MTMKARLRAALNRMLAPTGFELARVGAGTPPPSRWTMETALARAAALGIKPSTLIDIGAAEAEWARQAIRVFPSAALVMVEPLAERQENLARFAARYPAARIEAVVAGREPGEVELNVTDDLDGSGVYGPDQGGGRRRVPCDSVDRIVQRHGLQGPFLLKLDTHGYEIPIFEGASATLAHTALIVVEAYGFKPSPTAVRFWELCSWLGERGFRPADLANPVGRRRDGLLWQADFFFLRSDHPAFASNSYV